MAPVLVAVALAVAVSDVVGVGVAVGVALALAVGIAIGLGVVVVVGPADAVAVVVAVGDMMLPKRKPWRSKAYTHAAEGQPCTLRSPVCNGDPSTTVFCHLNESWAGKGMGQKADDFAGFDGCSDCHAYYDARGAVSDYMLLRAMYETIRNRLDRGILKRGKNG